MGLDPHFGPVLLVRVASLFDGFAGLGPRAMRELDVVQTAGSSCPSSVETRPPLIVGYDYISSMAAVDESLIEEAGVAWPPLRPDAQVILFGLLRARGG